MTDRHGRLIKNLNRDDFKVIDDGRPDTRITDFQKETNLPSASRSAGRCQQLRARPFQVRARFGDEFLSQTVRPKYDQAFVVGFDATPEVTQDFTDNNEQLAKGVQNAAPWWRHGHV